MTERRSKFDLEVEERLRVQQRAEAYDRDERERAELARIEGQRAELEEDLTERGRRYIDATGSRPTEATVAGWQREYVDATHAEHEAERQRRVEATKNQVF
jgi:hypothetical protein